MKVKAKDLKFPLVIYWYGNNYRVEEGKAGLDWTVLKDDGSDGYTYENSSSRDMIVSCVNDGSGNAIILSQPEEVVASLSIDVDSSKLAEAVKLAEQLEATLIRIKALLA